MSGFSNTWESLSPRLRQWLTLGAGLLVVAALALLVATAPEDRARGDAERRRMVANILTDVDPRDLGIDGLGRRMNSLEGEVRKIAYSLEQLGLDAADSEGAQAHLLQTLRREREAELAALQGQLQVLRDDVSARDQVQPPSAAASFTPPTSSASPSAGTFAPPGTPQVPARPEPPPLDQLFDPPPAARPAPADKPTAATSTLSIRHVQDDAAGAEPTAAEQADAAVPEVRIPAGSILQGVFLSGMDAPTGRAARQDPYPALLRLKHNAILPNRFRADIRECFLLVGGYGDLGSERVYLRAESINCVRRDGRTIEVAIDGYAVGEDGKVGVRGRLVNKQGQVIGRAMQVSFLQGFSRLFSTVPVASVATGGGAVPYQQVLSAESMQGAAIAGTGKALDRLAEYYLDLAENIFPVLEVDAGRGVEVILNRGVGLKLQ
jgi:conjugal transfer pilus assembly protein TraB